MGRGRGRLRRRGRLGWGPGFCHEGCEAGGGVALRLGVPPAQPLHGRAATAAQQERPTGQHQRGGWWRAGNGLSLLPEVRETPVNTVTRTGSALTALISLN